MLFSELTLKASSLKAAETMGFKEPSEIQEKSIPILLEKDVDFIGQAQTGTGKTAAFALPLLEKLDFSSKAIQAMVIAPTRELANQICEEIKKLSQFEPIRTLAVYGGVSIQTQLRSLKKDKPQIIVGTPGRLLDVMGRGAFDLDLCRYVVLDEADEMLDMGFFDDVQEILSAVKEKKIWMFSATMPKPILNMINKHFCNPELVKVTKKILTSDSIDQQFCMVGSRDMAEALCRFLDFTQDVYAIVFTRTKVGAKELTDELNMRGFPSDALHGDMSQEQRDLTMKKFKQKKLNLLVCTDVAARGIDVSDLTHVINYGLPQDNESYVHRIGRTGRGGSKGIALSIIGPSEIRRISQIERITQAKIERVKLPEVSDIVNVLMTKSCGEFETAIEKFSADDNYAVFEEKFAEKSNEELLKGLYSFIFDQSLKRYKNARSLDVEKRDKNDRSSDRSDRPERSDRSDGGNGAQNGYERFHITLGREKGMEPGDLIRLVSGSLDIRGGEIGKIRIMNDFAFFEVPNQFTDKILTLGSHDWKGEKFSIQVAKGKSSGPRPRRSGGSEGHRGRSAATTTSNRADGNRSDGNRADRPPRDEKQKSFRKRY